MILLKWALCLNDQIINSIVSQGFFQLGLKRFNGIVAVVWELIRPVTNLVAKRYGWSDRTDVKITNSHSLQILVTFYLAQYFQVLSLCVLCFSVRKKAIF